MNTTLTFDKAQALENLNRFEQHYGYDASYVRAILEADPAAFQQYSKLPEFGAYAQDIPPTVLFAVRITAIQKEDCGPCTQLSVKMAEEAGVPAEIIHAVLSGDLDAMPEEIRLAYQFTEAAMDHSPEADAYREEILNRWGIRALISMSFSLIAAKGFSTLRYSMGYGQTCSRVMVNGQPAKLKARHSV